VGAFLEGLLSMVAGRAVAVWAQLERLQGGLAVAGGTAALRGIVDAVVGEHLDLLFHQHQACVPHPMQ
jgi:hypothetical protein